MSINNLLCENSNPTYLPQTTSTPYSDPRNTQEEDHGALLLQNFYEQAVYSLKKRPYDLINDRTPSEE